MTINRRGFLTACLATLTAPAIVRASSLMPVKVREPMAFFYDPHWMPAGVWRTEVFNSNPADFTPVYWTFEQNGGDLVWQPHML